MESAILALRKPSRQAHDAFKRHFWNEESDVGSFPTLGGSSTNVYDDRGDLVALKRPLEEDRLTMFLRKHCALVFMVSLTPVLLSPQMEGSEADSVIQTRRPDANSSLAYISQYRITVVVGMVNIILAAAFLFGAIIHLYNVRKEQVKLGLIAGYTVAFAMALGLITTARRAEIFAACAAYSAVLVVFVSGDLGRAGSSKG